MRISIIAGLFLFAAATALAVIGGGDVTLKNKGGTVVFSHAAHVEGMGQKCQECHPKLYTNAKQHKAVTMKAMEKGKSCGACHDGRKAFSVKGDCAKCHKK
jgi:c(7)-type cytochrome triheme protein